MTTVRGILTVATVALLATCKSGPTGPVAGTLKVNLTTPNNGQDGAVLLTLTAPAVPISVSSTTDLLLWGGPVTGTTVKLVVTGTLSTGTILTLQVDDVNKASQYTVTLQQVAAAGTFLLRPPLLPGYSATVTK